MTEPILNLLNTAPFDYYYLAVDKFLDIDLPELVNFTSLSPDKLSIKLEEKNSGRLLNHPNTIEYINTNFAKTARKPVIIPFKPSSRIETICRKNNWIMASNQPSLNRYLEDKLKFATFCQQHQLPTLPHIIDNFDKKTFVTAQKNFGQDIVIQTHFGWAGNSSYLTNNFDNIKNNLTIGTIVKYSPYLSGYSLINNCCLTSQGLIQSPPGLQFTGIKPLTDNPLATVGRQWPSFAPQHIQTEIGNITNKFAASIDNLNYRGFFGLDFLVHQDNVYLLECNPRLTASFAFYTKLESISGHTPLFLLHIAEFLDISHQIDIDHETKRFSDYNIQGSEITSKNFRGVTLNKYQDLVPFTTKADPINIKPEILAKVY